MQQSETLKVASWPYGGGSQCKDHLSENHQSPHIPVKNLQFSQILRKMKVIQTYSAVFIKPVLLLEVRRGTDDSICHFFINKYGRGEEGKLEEELGEAG